METVAVSAPLKKNTLGNIEETFTQPQKVATSKIHLADLAGTIITLIFHKLVGCSAVFVT